MKKIVLLQIFATLGAAFLSFLIGGRDAAASAFLGGFSCAIPNAVLAVNLKLCNLVKPSLSPILLLVGEFIKIIVTVVLMYLVAVLYEGLVWPAMIATISVVLICSFLGFLTRE